MHLRRLADFLTFHTHYEPRDPARVVAALIAAHNRYPLIHDPHMLAYLGMPLLPLCAFALYILGRGVRPVASAITMMITISGTIYMGGVFGMWTAFYRGLGLVDPSNQAGAIATFTAMTTPQGAFLVTTTLAKLTMIGLAAQALVLLGTRVVPVWSVVSVAIGASMFLAFWDLDNWMLIGTVLILAGSLPMRKALVRGTEHSHAGNPARLLMIERCSMLRCRRQNPVLTADTLRPLRSGRPSCWRCPGRTGRVRVADRRACRGHFSQFRVIHFRERIAAKIERSFERGDQLVFGVRFLDFFDLRSRYGRGTAARRIIRFDHVRDQVAKRHLVSTRLEAELIRRHGFNGGDRIFLPSRKNIPQRTADGVLDRCRGGFGGRSLGNPPAATRIGPGSLASFSFCSPEF